MLATRLVTAAVLAASLFAVISFSDHVAVKVLYFCLFAGIAGTEFIALRWRSIEMRDNLIVKRPEIKPEHFFIGFLYGLAVVFLALGDYAMRSHMESGLAFVFVWCVVCSVGLSAWLYVTERNMAFASAKLINAMAGFIYISLPAVALYRMASVSIEGAPIGIGVYFCLAVALMGDTFAYFGGRLFGKRRLLPRVSPKKTLEGAYCGLIGSGITAVGVAWYFSFGVPLWIVFAVSVFAGAAGQIGDLMESALKRVANCKDSSGLLPGHGGALDRIDSVLFGAPLCNLIFFFNDIRLW